MFARLVVRERGAMRRSSNAWPLAVRSRTTSTLRWCALGVALMAALASLGVALPAGARPAAPAGIRPRAPGSDGLAHCVDGRRTIASVAGRQTDRFTTDLGDHELVDALGAMWLQTDNWPISFSGGDDGCWLGGRIVGTYPQSTPWADFHHTGALNFTNRRLTIADLRVHNYGDGIRAREGAKDFLITGVHLSFMHDDCIENDQLYSGVVEDSLLDGCYVAFSARPSAKDSVSGSENTYTIRDNVVRLQPMPTVYKGRAPGHGGFFKWDDTGRSPKLVVRDNVFRVDQRPNHQDLGLPKGTPVTCSNNVVVWLGKGPYPDRLPKCFRVTRDRRVWDDAVAQWYDAHPSNP